ncbi:hypothetical protein [Nostoc sp. DedQUE09]|uniref:hypothetical protein n=1 Tax=Nostoc sp. DedQUE09 TaxID=3075394 RepID=UPI002AD5411D|nr:hypothetical protein [Nostoc sp. DedQUE09]MDZ7955475.1 hypothetical protein [Nostoc sp. DedQUE09]
MPYFAHISITFISHNFADRLIVNFRRNKMTATSEKIIQPREWHNLLASKV